jgi:DNA primase
MPTIDERKKELLNRISAHDVLRHFGVTLKHEDNQEEKIRCPFHDDSIPSAKVYPKKEDSLSGLYCFVCRKRWNIFALWRELSGNLDMGVIKILEDLEQVFGEPI